MKVRFVKTGKTVTVDDSYGARLIEQGKANPVREEPFMNEPTEPATEEEPEAAKPKSGKNRKGE